MAVTFDSVAPGSSGITATTTSPATWTHVNNGNGIIVALANAAGSSNNYTTVTYGGVALTFLGYVPSNNQTLGGISLYGLVGASCPTGSNTVSAAWTGGAQTLGGSVTVAGAATFGTVFTAFGNSAAPSVGVTGTTAGGLVVSGFASGTLGTNTATGGGTLQWNNPHDSSSGAGNAGQATVPSAGGTTTASYSITADWWSIVAVEVQPPAGANPRPPAPSPQLPPGWFPGSDKVVAQPGVSPFYVPPAPAAVFVQPPPVLPDTGYVAPLPPGWFPGAPQTEPDATPFYQQPLPVTDPGAVIIPPAPDILGVPDWLPYPPYWFPGGDKLSGAPGGIPFWIQPQPDSSPSLPPSAGLPTITGLSGSTSAAWFKDQYGNPRWMFSDTVWTIVYSAGRSGAQSWQKDMDQVVSTRASQGYTALECNLLPNNEYIASGLTTWDGIHPFVTGTDPSSGLNDPYWQRVDYLLASLATHGMTLFMNLLMGEDLAAGVAGAWTSTQKTDYGNKVATRFLSVSNIVWMINDDGGVDDTTMTNILTGVRNAGDTRFIACENPQETTSRYGLKLSNVKTWGLANAQYNWVYTYSPSYGGVEYAYGEASPIPVIRGDGYYYNSDGNPSDKISRESFWWCITSGSRGYSWGMSDGGWGAFAAGWANNLTMGADEIGTAGDFQNNVFPAVTAYLSTLAGWQKLAPDINNVFITAGRGTRAPYQTEGIQNQYTGTPADTYVSGSIATDGTLALIYFSRGAVTTITINQALLGPGYTATWVDPANATTSAGTPGSTFTKPAAANSAGDHDWLLVLQGPAALPISAPGLPGYLPLPPGWFPGADNQVTAMPGGIPFAQPPVPDPGVTVTAVTIQGAATLAGAGSLDTSAGITQLAPATLGGAGALATAATQGAGTTLGGTGSLGNLDITGAPATLGGTGSLTTAAIQGAVATLSGTGSLGTAVTLGAIATLSGTGSLAALATLGAIATLAGTGSLGTAVTQAAGAVIGGTGSLTGSAGQGSNLSGTGSLTTAVIQLAPATLAGAGSLSTAVTQLAPATLSGTASLATAVTQLAPATLAGAGSLGNLDITGAPATLGGTGSLTTAAVQGVIATLAGTGSLTGSVGQGSTLGGQGSIGTLVTQLAPATLAAAGSLATAVTQLAPATLAGAGSLGNLDITGAPATLGGTGVLTTAAVQGAGASLSAAGSVVTAVIQGAIATLAGAGSLTAAGGPAGAASLNGTGSLTATGVVTGASGAVLTGTGSLTAAATLRAIVTLAGTGQLSTTALQLAGTVLAGAGSLTAIGTQHPPQVKGFIIASVSEAANIAASAGEAASMTSGVS